MKLSLMIALLLALLSGSLAHAQNATPTEVRDPFSPAVGAGLTLPGDPGQAGAPPLLQYPAESYQVVGILTSSNRGVAIVQNPAGARYYVRRGDALGADGYTITAMRKISVLLKAKTGRSLELVAKSAGGSE